MFIYLVLAVIEACSDNKLLRLTHLRNYCAAILSLLINAEIFFLCLIGYSTARQINDKLLLVIRETFEYVVLNLFGCEFKNVSPKSWWL